MNEYTEGGYPLAYLITIRTYGTWLHGDEKGSVDRHGGFNIYGTPRMFQSQTLKDDMKRQMKGEPFLLNKKQRTCVYETVKEVCDYRGCELVAVSVRTNHLHAVVSLLGKPERVVRDFKTYGTRRLRENGLARQDQKIGLGEKALAIFGNQSM